jgi:hypothetical protein
LENGVGDSNGRVVEHLHKKHEALSSNPYTAKKMFNIGNHNLKKKKRTLHRHCILSLFLTREWFKIMKLLCIYTGCGWQVIGARFLTIGRRGIR